MIWGYCAFVLLYFSSSWGCCLFFCWGGGVDFPMLSLLEFFSSGAMLRKRPEKCTFCGRWQINGNRNWWFPFTRNKSPPEPTNTFQAGSWLSPLLQIGAPSPPRMMSRTATAGLPQGSRAPQISQFPSWLQSISQIDGPARRPFQGQLPRGAWRRQLRGLPDGQSPPRPAAVCDPGDQLRRSWSPCASLCQKWAMRGGGLWLWPLIRRDFLTPCCRISSSRKASLRWVQGPSHGTSSF